MHMHIPNPDDGCFAQLRFGRAVCIIHATTLMCMHVQSITHGRASTKQIDQTQSTSAKTIDKFKLHY
jgi:hypothetical protein